MAAYGTVTSVKVIKDRETGKSKGFAFVEMENTEDAQAAMSALNGSEFMGRQMVIKEALPKKA
jgi:RNA recognition motif-containing protein